MIFSRYPIFLVLPLLVLQAALAGAIPFKPHPALDTSLVLKAMEKELARSRDSLPKFNGQSPYFISYRIWEVESFVAEATLGALENSGRGKQHYLDVDIRLGNYQRDNSNFAGAHDFRYQVRASLPQIPHEILIRQALWAATDAKYHQARQAFTQKEAYLKQVAEPPGLADFTPARPSSRYKSDVYQFPDTALVHKQLRSLSGSLVKEKHLRESRVAFQFYRTTFYYVDTEGSRFIQAFNENTLMAALLTQAFDGEPLWDYYRDTRRSPQDLSWLPDARPEILESSHRLKVLREEKPLDFYRGPVLFSGTAAAGLVDISLLYPQKHLRRQLQSGAESSFLPGLMGKKYLPEFVMVIDDPRKKTWQGRPLHGAYGFDHEGSPAQKVYLIKKGMLTGLLTGRTPILPGNSHQSNGHLRYQEGLPGVVEVHVQNPVSDKDLIGLLQAKSREEGNTFGLEVSRFEDEEAFHLLRHPISRHLELSKLGGTGETNLYLPEPVRIDKVDLSTGKKTPVRGLTFVPLDPKSLRTLLAAGQKKTLFEPRAVYSVISPSLLLGLLDLKPYQKDFPALPLLGLRPK